MKKAEKELKNKTILVSMWGCENKTFWTYNWGMMLYSIFKEVILFDPRKKRLEYGPGRVKNEFLHVVKQKQPDYILLLLEASDFGIETLESVKTISPNTKIIVHFGDDDIHFFTRSRYYSFFVDYYLIAQSNYVKFYHKEGFKNAYPFAGVNMSSFKPLNLEKKHDLVFIGQPLPSRVELIRMLIKNNFNISLFGTGWDKYQEFAEQHKGIPKTEELVKIVNEAKIVLNFTKNQYNVPHYKGRVFETAACKSFQLVDYFSEYKKYFKENKEIVMFKNEKDLLEKIKYYLKNDKEREKIATASYKKAVKSLDLKKDFIKFFSFTMQKNKAKKKLPSENVIILSNSDLLGDKKIIEDKIKDSKYIAFSGNSVIQNSNKNNLQVYSLKVNKKDLSCCDYNLSSGLLGNYMRFKVLKTFDKIENSAFNNLIDLSQLLTSKDYFLENIDKFIEFAKGNPIGIINKDNTAFISIPLISINRLSDNSRNMLNNWDNKSLESSFVLGFMYKLYSIVYQKRKFSSLYPYKLLLHSIIKGETFIPKYVYNYYRHKGKIDILDKDKDTLS